MTTRVPLIFGTMTIGQTGANGVRISDMTNAQEMLDCFFRHGHKELDTARMYAEGTTEACLAKLDLHDAVVDTKVYPVKPGDHSPEALRATFEVSLATLAPYKPRVLYLHAPDRSVPFEDTLAEIDKLYKEKKFEIFGLSNFAAWEVAEVVGICKANQYVLPKIYQAMYNPITRAIEEELVPCLRKFQIRLVIYNPLAGGFFAGKITSVTEEDRPEEGRFSGESKMARMYRDRYFNDGYFAALDHLKSTAEEHNLRLTEVALRWCQHHSVLGPGDGVIIGASSLKQLEQNCTDSEKGPLPEPMLVALEQAWIKVGFNCPRYWR